MTKLIHVGYAYDSKTRRRFHFCMMEDEILDQARKLVRAAYTQSDDVPKGGEEEMKLTKEMSEAERRIAEYAKKRKLYRQNKRKKLV